MAVRRGPRRRQPSMTATSQPTDDTSTVPHWVEGVIARGKMTPAGYRQRQRELRERRRQEFIHLVPPAVEMEGPEAVERWADEMVDQRDPRLELLDRRGSRDPLTHAEAFRRDEARRG